MAKLKIKKGDRVVVLAGKDKGKKGEVLKVLPQESRVIVNGVNMIKRHQNNLLLKRVVLFQKKRLSMFLTSLWKILKMVAQLVLVIKH